MTYVCKEKLDPFLSHLAALTKTVRLHLLKGKKNKKGQHLWAHASTFEIGGPGELSTQHFWRTQAMTVEHHLLCQV